jgi:hypothetical protein
VDTRNAAGEPLDFFGWLSLTTGRLAEQDLQYNELGAELGPDGKQGWSFWSAPFTLDEGLIDDSLPPDQWHTAGVPLPLPGGTRYVQFRILFDSSQHSAALLDFIEFDYDTSLVSGGVVAEIFPASVALGEEETFRYFIRPLFADGEQSGFNRIEINVPADTRVDTLKFDGLVWDEIPVLRGDGTADDPLQGVVAEAQQGDTGAVITGQFAQAMEINAATGRARILLKLPLLEEADFRAKQNIELVFRARLFRGFEEFSGAVWNDQNAGRLESIPQPFNNGDAAPQVGSDAVRVIVNKIDATDLPPLVSPNPFTPNGDGINDQITIRFDVLLALDKVEANVTISDLSGRVVRHVGPARQTVGPAELTWNGRDEAGEKVPPGLYIYTLQVDTDLDSSKRLGTLSVVY